MSKALEFRKQLTKEAIAGLLKIPVTEYHHLSHKPLQAFCDLKGKVIEFYIHISSNNHPQILNKLQLDKRNFVCFLPEQVYKAIRQSRPAVTGASRPYLQNSTH